MTQKVLIIDDSKTSRRQIAKIVSSLHMKVFEAENGKWGLEMLGKIGECSLIFCDAVMAEMNGLEFLKALRSDTRYAKIPVIMMTSEPHSEDKQAFEPLQVMSWLRKPVTPPEVKGLFEKLG